MFLQSSVSSVSFSPVQLLDFMLTQRFRITSYISKICHLYDLVCNYWVSTKELGMIYFARNWGAI